MEPAKTKLGIKAQIRQAIKDEKIPHTFVCCNLAFTYFLSKIGQVESTWPPTEKIFILGDRNTKAFFAREEDMATYTIKAVDDPKALNKTLYMRLPTNIFSHNELITLWEKKTGKTFERIYVPEEEVLKKIQAPLDFVYDVAHAAFAKGFKANYEIDPSTGVEASEIYPDVKYTTVDEFLYLYM